MPTEAFKGRASPGPPLFFAPHVNVRGPARAAHACFIAASLTPARAPVASGMNRKHKPIQEQVLVITGASSGIGLATAQEAARRGASLVLAARSGAALEQIAGRLSAGGANAIAIACDVTNRAQVERLAQAAIDRFGRIDTWV